MNSVSSSLVYISHVLNAHWSYVAKGYLSGHGRYRMVPSSYIILDRAILDG